MAARISLTMIVKNEASTLSRCLASVRGLVDEIIVVDTGSSDNTKDIAEQRGARVYYFPWPDSFADARNESLSHASGQWILWLDADEQLDEPNRNQLRQLLSSINDENTAFVMKCSCLSDTPGTSTTNVDHIRLFRNHPAIRWDYRVHEQILPALQRMGQSICFTDIVITHTGYTDPAMRYRKVERNLRLLHMDLAERPNDPFTLFNLGWTYADLGHFAEAVPILQSGLQHSHNFDCITPKLYSLLAHCQLRLGQFSAAWNLCNAGHVRFPEHSELLFIRGQLCHHRGDRAAARTCWLQLLQNRPLTVAPSTDGFTSIDSGVQGPLVRHHLAVLDHEEGHFADAENHWRTILDESPEFQPARLGLAELYLQAERWPELETLFTELEPYVPLDTALFRARMHLARKEFALARQMLEDVLRQAPHALTANVFLSHVLLQSGDESAAEPLLRRIVAMDPRQIDSWRNLIVLYRRQNRLAEAIGAARTGCWHCPHDADLLLLQGALLQESGDWGNAESCLLRVMEMGGRDGPARQRLAMARHRLAHLYRRLGRVREAVAHWRELLVESPEFSEARRCLEECGAAQPLAS